MDSQPEFFGELPRAASPRERFGEVRVRNKIIPIPFSVWKDGRMRGDLTAYDAGEFVSRNPRNFWEQVTRRLQERFNTTIVEVVSEVSQELPHSKNPPQRRPPRLRKKFLARELAHRSQTTVAYANPLAQVLDKKSERFGKFPDWLLRVPTRILGPSEKLIYGRLLFPLPPICKNFRKDTGEIIELNQEELASAVGMKRQTANGWMISLQAKKWIECDGPQGAKQIIRFFWKEHMPETCRTYQQLSGGKMPNTVASHAGHLGKEHAEPSSKSCRTSRQLSQGIEKRESRREERKGGLSFRSYGAADF
jgi:hypothetical protein